MRIVHGLVSRVEKAIERHRLLADGDAILVAVSGGADSMALLRVLQILGRKHHWKLIVAHFNHLLRGRESDGDERFVMRAAQELGLPFEFARGDVKQFARERKLSLEMAGRILRHEFLARTARQRGGLRIALAHHADDQLELFFLRLFRGAGTEGLAGMKWTATSPADREMTLVRPLLAEAKSDLLRFVRAEKLRFRNDRTNRSSDILRNRIRRQLLPRLRREFQPELHRTVLRAMEVMRSESEFVNASAKAWLTTRRRATFESLPLAVQRSVIQRELHRLGIQPQFEWVEKLRQQTGWLTLAAGVVCRRTSQGLETGGPEKQEFQPFELPVILGERRGESCFDSRRIRWRRTRRNKRPARRVANVEFFDARAIGDQILLRHWRPGDRFQPIGFATATKLQDVFVNEKVPRERRRSLLVATTAGGKIFWVEGLRIGEHFKVTVKTQEILRWQWDAEPDPGKTTL